MQKLITIAALGGAVLMPFSAIAEVTGGTLSLSHSAFTKDTSVAKTSLEGSLEYGFDRNFAVQGDLAYNDLNASDTALTNATLHGIYHMNDSTSLGGFVGVDRVQGDNSSIVGLEFGHAFDDRTGMEGFVARNSDSGDHVTQIGLSGHFQMTEQVGFGTSLDYANAGSGTNATRFGVSTDYSVTPNTRLSAELGQLDANAFGFGGSETYVKLGAKINFGAKRGVTFGTRSIGNLLPGL